VENGAVSFGGIELQVPDSSRNGRSEVVLGLRPESLELASDGCPATVEAVEEIGADTHLFCAAEIGGLTTKLAARVPTSSAARQGDRIHLRPAGSDAHFFDPVTGGRIAT
jgi:multiple sugar transport system ATP-binding protein